jgi:hypothetical protein
MTNPPVTANNAVGAGRFPFAKSLPSEDKFQRDYSLRLWKIDAQSAIMRYDNKGRFKETIAAFGRKYLWWKPIGEQPHSEGRIIAQTMNLGTYDDILLLEQTVGKARLVEIMLDAEPGWLNDRSWEFWRGRLSFATGAAIPNKAPRRAFH